MRTALLLLVGAMYAQAVSSPAIQDALLLKLIAKASAFDGEGNLFLAGTFIAADAPNQTLIGPGSQQGNLYVMKIDASRHSVVYTAKIGGSDVNTFGAFTVDVAGNAYLAGSSSTADIPASTGAFKPSANAGSSFVVKLDKTGKLAYSTYLDQSEKTQIRALAVNSAGNLYAAGATDGLTFPTSPQSYLRSVPADIKRDTNTVGFIAQLKADGTGLVSSTLFGGTYDQDAITAIAIGPDGTVHVAGSVMSSDFPLTAGGVCRIQCSNSFWAQFDAGTSSVLYSGALGGSQIYAMAIDAQGGVWAVQNVLNTVLFSRRDAQNAAQRTPNLIAYSVQASSLFFLPNGHLVLAATAASCDLPTVDAIMPCPANQRHDPNDPNGFFPSQDVNKTGFVMEFDTDTNLVMSTPIGGFADSAIYTAAADPKGGIFVQGFVQDKTFPSGEALMGNVDGTNYFTFRLDTAGLPHGKPTPTRIVNAMSFAQAPLSAGSFATLFGSGLGPAAGASFALGPDNRVPTEVAGVQVTVSGVPAPVLYAQDAQINIVVPQGVNGSGDVCVIRGSDRTCVFSYIQTYDPGVFRFYPGGSYAIFNQDGTLNSAINPASAGTYITVWGAGFGGYTRSFVDGGVTDLPLAYLSHPVTAVFHDPRENCVGIGGTCQLYGTKQGEVSFGGAAPLAVSGLTQINIKVPAMFPGTGKFEITNDTGATTRLVVSFK